MVFALANPRISREGTITMTISSVSNDSTPTSPWQTQYDTGSTLAGSSFDSSISAAWPPPPPPQGPPPTADASATDSSGTTASSDSTTLDNAVAQLIAGLQSFLLNLQSNNGTDATASTSSADGSTTAAGAAAAGTATASTTTAPTTDDLFADLNTVLGDLQGSAGSQPPGPDQSQAAGTDSPTGSTDATQGAAPGAPPHGHHDLLADLLNAVQSYSTQPTQTAQLAATSSVSA
jgi:hypothetical protein